MYYVYIIRCKGGSLYTGTAADWQRRLAQHARRDTRAARYTRAHPMEALEALWETEDKSAALRLEWRIKRLSAPVKRRLIHESERWAEFLPELSGLACRSVEGAVFPPPLSPAPGPSTSRERR